MGYPTVFVQNCTNANRFNGFGWGGIVFAEAMAYSVFPHEYTHVSFHCNTVLAVFRGGT
jgi:hypothetical protein